MLLTIPADTGPWRGALIGETEIAIRIVRNVWGTIAYNPYRRCVKNCVLGRVGICCRLGILLFERSREWIFRDVFHIKFNRYLLLQHRLPEGIFRDIGACILPRLNPPIDGMHTCKLWGGSSWSTLTIPTPHYSQHGSRWRYWYHWSSAYSRCRTHTWQSKNTPRSKGNERHNNVHSFKNVIQYCLMAFLQSGLEFLTGYSFIHSHTHTWTPSTTPLWIW